MQQDIRFCGFAGTRIAYATVGDGPLLIFPGRFFTHLEEEWANPPARAFFEFLAATHRVVRFDRVGAGLSERTLPERPSVELDTRALAAVHEAVGGGPAVFFAWSECAGRPMVAYARRCPDLVRKLVFFGCGGGPRTDIPEPTQRSLQELVATNWELATRMLAGLFLPSANGDEIATYARYLQLSADSEITGSYFALDWVADVTDLLPDIQAPALVLHRRRDRIVPFARGRELAARLPNARFVPLDGDAHLMYHGDQRVLRKQLAAFLGDDARADVDVAADSPLSGRETQVLRLVAAGLSNREIASSLVLSEHTVHRHVANILRKLTQPSRAAAAAHAARVRMI